MARTPAKASRRKRAATDVASADVDAAAPESSTADTAVADSASAIVPGASQNVADVAVGPAIALEANCTIKEVAALRERLCAVVATSGPVMIDASAVERVDTATLQLLHAFVRDRLGGDREVTWRGVPAALTDAARLLGVRDLLCLPAAS
ncbi:STAS domain-containing protein [Povalibacter sp.]|uniref:STAS domain-containing protein n=1 Tax=Povalibacter sp. TaxID=1962978 RepID=UPI002F400B39